MRARFLAALTCVVACALAPLPAVAQVKHLRFASAFDPQSMDPHALALLYQTRVVTQIYEGLVNRAKDYKLEPSLATSWEMLDATTWRFKLRAGVKFHDGAAFSADDAVFSIERALDKASQRKNQMLGIVGAKKVDAQTIDITTAAPDAVLPEKLWLIAMMSKPWCEKHGVQRPQDYNAKQETFAVRNANGTGPFMLARYESDVRTLLKANPAWWGKGTPDLAGRFGGGNLDEVSYQVIQSDATRLAALAVGPGRLRHRPAVPGPGAAEGRQEPEGQRVDDIGTQYFALEPAQCRAARQRRQGAQPVQGPARAARRATGDRHRPDRAPGAARRGHGHRLVRLAAGRWLRDRVRAAAQGRRGGGARAAQGGRLRERFFGADGLRQRRLARLGLPGRRGDAREGRHPCQPGHVAERDLLSQAEPGHRQPGRVRLERVARSLGHDAIDWCAATTA